MNRRAFLRGAALAAPVVILTPGLLMPVRKVVSLEWMGIDLGQHDASVIAFLRETRQRVADAIVCPSMFADPMTASEVMYLQNEGLKRMGAQLEAALRHEPWFRLTATLPDGRKVTV